MEPPCHKKALPDVVIYMDGPGATLSAGIFVGSKENSEVSSGDRELCQFAELSDEALMKAYQGGDSAAFKAIYERHSARVYGYLRSKLRDRAQVDDVFQATFLKLHHCRNRYDHAFPFAPWLYTVCRSVLLDHLRATSRNIEDASEQQLLEKVAHETPADGSEITPEITMERLAAAGIPENQKAALLMRYRDDLSFEEIAAALNTSPANVRQLISRGVRRLRTLFEKGGTNNE